MTGIHPASLTRLVRSVAVLALPFGGQLAWLRSLGLGEPALTDEIAIELGDGALLARQFEEVGWLNSRARELILQIDVLLQERSGPAHAELWTPEALRSSPDWDSLRELALDTLIAL